ncbi:MAG: S8 family serine peptidase [Firmicutes bacterium]|nr:S8 family serine peptidase [Bacillota bacterium]
MKKYAPILILLILTFTLLCSVGIAAEEPDYGCVVTFDTKHYSDDAISAVAEEYGLTHILLGFYSCGEDTAAVLADHPMVLSVEIAPTGVLGEVNDINYNDAYLSSQWNLDTVNIRNCWKYYTTGSSDVRICVIDSGFYYDHPDAQKNFLPGKDYTSSLNPTISDATSHGTSVAGLIGATTNNSIGIAGLMKDVTVYNLRTFYWDDEAKTKVTTADLVAQAIVDSVDVYDADIINMSLLFGESSDVLEAACDYAEENGVLIFAAAGNNASEGSPLQYPATYDSVIGVGAVDANKKAANFSARNRSVYCCAPGVNITTLQNPFNPEHEDLKLYYRHDAGGTSLATPHVAALAAMALSYDPEMTSAEFRTLLKASCTDLGDAGYDITYGHGLINFEKMMKLIDGNVFDDVPKYEWYHDAVLNAYEDKLMVGLSDTLFGPDTKLTRGMFVTILYRMDGEPEVTAEVPFTDLPDDFYYNVPIAWAYENKVAMGVSETAFAPDKPISRQEVVTMLYRYYTDHKGQELPENGSEVTFRDADEIADWAKDAVSAMTKAGALSGYKQVDADGEYYVFLPERVINRAETAMILSNLSK